MGTEIDQRPDLKEMLSSLSEAHQKNSCLLPNGRISPFLAPPYDYIRPGVETPDAYRFHEIYPEVFKRETGFMGRQRESVGVDDMNWLDVTEIKVAEGGFDIFGGFYSPFALYQLNKVTHSSGNPTFPIFQQGSYQYFTPNTDEELEELIEYDKVRIHRGIRNSEFREKSLDNRAQELLNSGKTFLSCSMALGENCTSRTQTNHVNKTSALLTPHEDHYSLDEGIAKNKFGPNYITFRTGIENLRIISQWTGENEVRMIDRLMAKRLR